MLQKSLKNIIQLIKGYGHTITVVLLILLLVITFASKLVVDKPNYLLLDSFTDPKMPEWKNDFIEVKNMPFSWMLMHWAKYRELPLNNNQGYTIEVEARGIQGEGRPAVVVANGDMAFSLSRMDASHLVAEINPDLVFSKEVVVEAKQNEKQILRVDIPSSLKYPVRFIYSGKIIAQTYLQKPLTYPLTLYLLHHGESGQTEFNLVSVKNYEVNTNAIK